MIAILILLGIFFGVVLFFCRNLRQSVMNRLTTASYYVAGAWNNITNSVGGTNWAVVRTILWIVLAALILPLLLALFFVVLLAIAITLIGLATGSVWVSIPFGIAFVIWFIFYQIPRALNRLPVYGRLIQLTRWVAGLIALVCLVPLAMGIVMPDVKSGIIRRAWNEQKQAGNNLDEGSAHSEPEAGIIRKVKEDIYGIPDVPGKEPFFIKAGDTVKVLNWDGKKANDQREGLTKVMARNKFRHFDGGDEGWVPTRVLEEGSPSSTKTPPTPSLKNGEGSKWYLFWEKPADYSGANPLERAKETRVEITALEDSLEIKQFYKSGGQDRIDIFFGKKTEENVYSGEWKIDKGNGLWERGGDFSLTYDPEKKVYSGWQTFANDPTQITTKVYKK